MNYLYTLYATTAISIVSVWTSVLFQRKWSALLALSAVTVNLAYIPYFLTLVMHDLGYNFNTIFQTLRYLLNNQGLGA